MRIDEERKRAYDLHSRYVSKKDNKTRKYYFEIENLEDGAMVVYRPLYLAKVYEMGKHWDARPLKMFMEKVVKEGNEINRFTRITDPKIISELEKIRDKMYENFH